MRAVLKSPWWALVVAGCGCTPANEWRELRPEDSGIVASFPCKPDRLARTIALAGQATRMEMLVCSAGGLTFGLAFADIGDPRLVTQALAELRAAAMANLRATAASERSLAVPGMTPNERAARLHFEGQRPDGAAMQEQAAFFVRGLRIYQASILGPTVAESASEPFFIGLRLTP